MRISILIPTTTLLLGAATALTKGDTPNFPDWHPAPSKSVRGPCPGLNTLANHGFIPHDGKNITIFNLTSALISVYNIAQPLADELAGGALKVSHDPGAGVFDLSDLNKHNIIEHDGSLTREDYNVANGDVHTFHPRLFRQFLGYLGDSGCVDLLAVARARWGRIQKEKERDSKFVFGAQQRYFSLSESASYWMLLKDPKTGKVPLEWVKIFFEQERLPFEKGWLPPNPAVTKETLADVIKQIALLTPEDKASKS
ncbi:Cloroperoxidase [Delitschia confertaspora ATCC 74209]|uniref:Cloroperoxidase n=1 Tax=Delitschia confertaspora ATCC 74209 TaxID=1513339 RepID=A0A9P4JVK6_9PLEO|nr:Cloroperoxidase [Delitschia confertaspora ATCC 74209]